MTLDDNLWKTLKGGYKIDYDVSIPLRRLEQTENKEEIKKILDELWNELHHQGDVGLASYMALPQLVRISKSKGLFDWNVLAICSVIEQQRHLGHNPPLPKEFTDYYKNGLMELKEFVISKINSEMDETLLLTALSTLATCNGQVKLGKAIINLEPDVLDEFLERF
jgi:hypothetical protein